MSIADYPITSKFNEIDNTHPEPHKGLDFATPLGTPVNAYNDGQILVVLNNDKILGNAVYLKLNDGKIIIYGHLSDIKVKPGQIIHKDDIIGLTGNTGKSTGAHVHITMIKDGKTIDPTPYFVNDNSGLLIFPLMLVLFGFMVWKFRKVFLYGLVVLIGLGILFVVS